MPETFESIPGVRLKKVGDFKTPSFIKRHGQNPILTASMMPYPSSLVFNASVVEFDGHWLMMFRNEFYPVNGVPAGNAEPKWGHALPFTLLWSNECKTRGQEWT